MSRVPVFPSSRRPQTPSSEDGTSSSVTNSTKPLQISRPNRPNTPSNKPGLSSSPRGQSQASSILPNGPSRPQRSGLRTRQVSEYSNSDTTSLESRGSRDARDRGDSIGTTRSEISGPQRTRNYTGNTSNGRLQPIASPISPASESEMSPSGLAAIAAFQNVVAKKRGMSSDELMDAEYARERERELAIQKDRQKRIRDKVPGRKATGKPRAGDIDAVLDEIKGEWEAVIDPDFNPVDLALQLLDDSSLGKDIDSFRRTKDMLSKALKGSVDKHYLAFAAALPHHASLVNHLEVTQSQISDARTALQEAKDTLGTKRSDLNQLWSRNQTVEEMLRILDQIEHLRSVPDALESLISEKRLLQAAALLVRSLKLINKQDMLDIGALSDLRSYLNGQETSLREILVDELHSHLYLKSFWCESRWAVYAPHQQTFPMVEFEAELRVSDQDRLSSAEDSPPASPTSRRTRLSRFLDDLAVRPNEPPYDINEPSFRNSNVMSGLSASASMSGGPYRSSLPNMSASNVLSSQSARDPEADSFAYIETLLEALAVLGKLGHALDIVGQKVPQEIFALVEATLNEVADRAEYGKRGSILASIGGAGSAGGMSDLYLLASSGASGIVGVSVAPTMAGSMATASGGMNASALRLAALESSTKFVDQEIMRDFFWTLYSKLDAVAQGLRVVYEVATRIGSRRDFKDSSGTKAGALFPLAEIWAPVQAEIRTLQRDYITDEEQGTVSGRNPISSINEVLREGRFNRDRVKPAFRFADTDLKLTSKILREHEDELTRVLKDTVPGLVQGSTESAVQATLSAVGTDDRMLGSGQHHRVLVHPDAFHVSVLFQPTLAFMDRLADVLPWGQEASRESSMDLEEFVLKVYLPQLEDKVSMLFHQTVTSPDAFQSDPASTRLSSEPLVKASVQLMALINSLCAMLRTTPFHRESYARLILTVIVQFYQRCSDKFQDLVSVRDPEDLEGPPRISLAAQWAQRPEVSACLTELLSVLRGNAGSQNQQQLCRQEGHLELNLLGDNAIKTEELIASTRNLSAMSSLYRSITWFATELDALKSSPEGAISPSTPLRLEPVSASTPYTPYLTSVALPPNAQLRLPLSAAMALRFQALHKTYEQLSESVLHTIRVDIRCRAMHHLDLALRQGTYRIEREAAEPDPHIVDLNVELGKCEAFASTALPLTERRFLFEGLGRLLENSLIANAKHIRFANANGIKKMMRNILALQQNMKTIAEESQYTEFERAKRYYSLFFVSPPDMLDSIRQKQEFSFDEYKTMLDLQCGVDPSSSNAGAPAADRNYSMYIIDLHGLELENSAEDGSL